MPYESWAERNKREEPGRSQGRGIKPGSLGCLATTKTTGRLTESRLEESKMHIKVGKIGGKEYVITSDELNIILNVKKKRGEESKNPGEEYLVPDAYFSSLTDCIQYLVEAAVRASTASSLTKLAEDIAEIKKTIKEKLKGL